LTYFENTVSIRI